MKRKADLIKQYDGPNPFGDSQPRNYSDTKILDEFCPTSCFWSLFNDQHEVLLGTRGSGKTYLLKAMRRSMLKRIHDPKATEIVNSYRFIALYVPMHLEIVSEFEKLKPDSDRIITIFQFFFNCLLAEAIIQELEDILSDEEDEFKATKLAAKLSRKLDFAWFNGDSTYGKGTTFKQLIQKIRNLYYSFDLVSGSINDIPSVFKRQICTSLIVVKSIISDELELEEEPTWIVCVDEAEFLNEVQQKCINSMFRADSNRIALKVATLPFYHRTLDTLIPEIKVCAGNDYSYRFIDMRYDSTDFIRLTNQLCSQRLKTRLTSINIDIDCLEEFLGKIGNDDLIDYYREEVGEEQGTREVIEAQIIENFSAKRREGSKTYSNKRKTIYDKFAPIFFVREMYKLAAHQGHHKPGWYAGANTVRKISQGNPRMFIQLMNALFEKARWTKLTPKTQHEVMLKFCEDFCNATQGLDYDAYNCLSKISNYIMNKVHRKDKMVTIGSAFSLNIKKHDDFDKIICWLQEAIAHSRLIVAEDSLINGLKETTKFCLSNAYAAYYWIPMRTDSASKIPVKISDSEIVIVNTDQVQMSFFEEVT